MTFTEADGQFDELRRRYQSGALTGEQFDAELRRLMVLDGSGRWWAKARESGAWHYYDTVLDRWTPAQPPTMSAQPPSAAPGSAPAVSGLGAGASPFQPAAYDLGRSRDTPGTAGTLGTADLSDLSALADAPALTNGVKVLFAILSVWIPLLGILLFFVYRRKPHPADRAAARLFLILGIVSLVISCLCSTLFVAATQSAILNWGP